jgi:hypothetical protein
LKKVLLLLLITTFTFWFPTAYKRWTHAFRPAKCLVDWPHVPEWEIEPLSPEKQKEIIELLNEPFSYLGKGAQSYVFLSRDQKYVLKLFRYDRCRMPLGQQLVRQTRKWIGAREKIFLTPEFKIAKNFTSCKLAYSLAQKQTGVVFVSLNPQKNHLPLITLKDRLGRTHKIDPALYRFALQKKAEPFLPTFYAHIDNVQPLFDSYITLLNELASLGLVNLDPSMGRNFGFLDGRAIQIDFGNFIYCPEHAATAAAPFEHSLRKWLKKRIPNTAF